ncbi:MAG: restriction endonuclease, partial [Dehalococcoidia bacterium]|nr:restriction endonuclease [Dehalococcoidia bacterium]
RCRVHSNRSEDHMPKRGQRYRANGSRRIASEVASTLTKLWIAAAVLHPFVLGGLSMDVKTGLQYSPNFLFLIVTGLLPFAAWCWLFVLKEKDREAGKAVEELQALSSTGFEEWVAARFRELGYSVKLTGNYGDHGIDLVVQKPGELAVVQCKNYKAWKVGEPVLRDLFGAMHDHGANRAYLVTTGKLTGPAARWVAGKPIEILDRDSLVRLSSMKTALAGANANMENIAADALLSNSIAASTPIGTMDMPTLAEVTKITCPLCGAEMVEKRNRQTGQPFLACPRFPNCRYTRPVPS